jgi:hypothetical protein
LWAFLDFVIGMFFLFAVLFILYMLFGYHGCYWQWTK